MNNKYKLKQIFYIFLSIIFFILVIWTVLISNFIVNENIFKNSWNNIIAVILTILGLYFVFHKYKTDIKYVERLKEKKQGKFITYLSMLIIIPLCSKLMTDRSLMMLFHTFSNYPSSKIVYVDKKISTRACRNGIKLLNYQMIGNGRICGVPKDILDDLKYSQKIIVTGYKSLFGFNPKGFDYEKEK